MVARTLVLCLVLVAGCASAAGSPVPSSPDERVVAQAAGEADEGRPAVRALAILHRWDHRRAAAYAAGDHRALRRLYAPASTAGARDVRILRSYAERGLVVEELTVQVLDVQLVSATPTTLRLRVLDRVAAGKVVPASGGAGEASLPAGRPVHKVVVLVDLGGRWVVRAVRHG